MSDRAQSLGPVRIVLVEDSDDDAELLAIHLADAGIDAQLQRVETAAQFAAALDDAPDLVISDVSLPRFSGYEALRMLRARYEALPFLLVSGALDECDKAEARRRGASDCLSKHETARLPAAVVDAIASARNRVSAHD